MGLDFKVDTKQVDQFLRLAPKKTSIAVLRSIKRGGQAAKTEAARTVSKDMGLPVSVVRKMLSFKPPNAETLTAIIRASLRRIPLIKFGAKQAKAGVSYKAKGGRKKIKSAFISTMPTGHVGVFKRAGKGRLPIGERYGPSVGHVMSEHREKIAGHGWTVAEKEFQRQLDRIFGVKSR